MVFSRVIEPPDSTTAIHQTPAKAELYFASYASKAIPMPMQKGQEMERALPPPRRQGPGLYLQKISGKR